MDNIFYLQNGDGDIAKFVQISIYLKGVFAKYDRLNAIKYLSKFTSICCVHKEKIVKDVSYRITLRPFKFRKLQLYDLDRKKIHLISNKSFRYYNL